MQTLYLSTLVLLVLMQRVSAGSFPEPVPVIEPSDVTCKCHPKCGNEDTCTIFGACVMSGTGGSPRNMYLGCMNERQVEYLCNEPMLADISCCSHDMCNDVWIPDEWPLNS
ncbi:uncharacterized protein LOC102805175 [Saccoglossus kowalevskii]